MFEVNKISFQELILVLSQGCTKWIKSDRENIYNVTKRFLFQINAVLLNFLFIKEFWEIQIAKKCIMIWTEILSSTTFFYIDNNKKYLLSTKSTYYNDF